MHSPPAGATQDLLGGFPFPGAQRGGYAARRQLDGLVRQAPNLQMVSELQ